MQSINKRKERKQGEKGKRKEKEERREYSLDSQHLNFPKSSTKSLPPLVFELTEQLRGRCGERQVEGARVALAENGGGFVQADAAAMVVSVLSI